MDMKINPVLAQVGGTFHQERDIRVIPLVHRLHIRRLDRGGIQSVVLELGPVDYHFRHKLNLMYLKRPREREQEQEGKRRGRRVVLGKLRKRRKRGLKREELVMLVYVRPPFPPFPSKSGEGIG
jgi:hypothetical protein